MEKDPTKTESVDTLEQANQLLESCKGKKITNANTDGSTITLEFEDGNKIVISRGSYEDVPDNSFLKLNDLDLW